MRMHTALELADVEALIPYARNSRTHSDAQVAQIVASIREFGFTNPVLIDEGGGVIAGHGRIMAAKQLGMAQVPALVLSGLTDAQKRAYVIADNQLALNAGWDEDMLRLELTALSSLDFDLDLIGFNERELAALVGDVLPDRHGEDSIPDAPAVPVSRPGDVWLCGDHRVMCGDSTDAGDVARLANGETATLVHADPPYGMGKQSEGVANDNLYREKLDAFQMAWWRVFRAHLADQASAYIWGNAPELWRLWYDQLAPSEHLELKNEIVWHKGNAIGMASDLELSFPTATERCLYFAVGKQFLGNINTDDFPPEWEPLRGYLAGEAEAAGLTAARLRELCGVGMFSHWFSRSQFTLIPAKHYATLQAAFPAQFRRPWSDLKAEWATLRGKGNSFKADRHASMRCYFDNAHDAMCDVWQYGRVVGDERHGHATPKPVDMMARVMKTSLPSGGLVLRAVCGLGLDPDGGRAHRPALLHHGIEPGVRRCRRTPLAGPHRQDGNPCGHRAGLFGGHVKHVGRGNRHRAG